ncbi:hypothetical protein PGTUg99_036307 [Puccinia graminis f. sp. tritici]|uniref:Uncharacterized protein n=1 Tax=Puccinia graminis f. sp. tritici TaxID=56615 RepID=A0A5B0N4U0_PUCGR|nr:hypothetical protein PGTUg99_036307 [Puccinia graminis f. sp. tritici]
MNETMFPRTASPVISGQGPEASPTGSGKICVLLRPTQCGSASPLSWAMAMPLTARDRGTWAKQFNLEAAREQRSYVKCCEIQSVGVSSEPAPESRLELRSEVRGKGFIRTANDRQSAVCCPGRPQGMVDLDRYLYQLQTSGAIMPPLPQIDCVVAHSLR